MKAINHRLASLIFLSLIIFFSPSVAFSRIKVLYGSSAVALPTQVQEFVYSGFVLALKNGMSETEIKNLIIQDQRPGLSPMEAYDVIQQNLNNHPNAVFGFPSTHESQLVYPVVKDKGILTVFASSTNNNLRDAGPTVFSTSDDPKVTISAFLDIINKQYTQKKGMVLYFSDDYFSLNQKQAWEEVLAHNKHNVSLHFHSLKKGKDYLGLSEILVDYDYVVITSFPTVAFDLLNYMKKNKIDKTLFTNSSWYKVNHEVLSRILADKQHEVYMVDMWDRQAESSKNFFRKYVNAYHSDPGIESAIGYDLGLILLQLLERSDKDTSTDLLKVFHLNLCFSAGSPLGDVCFDKKGGYGKRKLNLIRYKNGEKIVLGQINT